MSRSIRQQKAEAGTSLAEFAISLVIVLTVLFGIIDIGRALYAYNWVSNAARLSTRYGMVRGSQCTALQNYPFQSGGPDGGCPAYRTDFTNYVTQYLRLGINASQVTVTTNCFATDTALYIPPCAPGGWVQVQVQYNFMFLSPLVPPQWNHWTMTSISERVVQN